MSRITFSSALILFLVSALAVITNHQGFALKILTICFWFLLGGFVFYFYETIKK